MLRKQLPRIRTRAVLHDAVSLGAIYASSNEFVARRSIEIDSLLVAAPTFLYAFRDRLCIALEFRGSLSSFLPQLVRALLVIVHAPHQAQTGGEKAQQNEAGPRDR